MSAEEIRVELGELLHQNITDSLPTDPTRNEIGAQVDTAIDIVLAAGYRCPRTVTTVEELDALPVDSVVMETEEDTFVIRTMRGVFHRFPDGWYVVAGYDARHNIALPATVLYEPEATK